MKILKIVACLLFFSFVWSVGYGDIPLKQKKEEQAKQAPVDGPYVLYDKVGNVRVIWWMNGALCGIVFMGNYRKVLN